jgi:hypothetical protein
MKPRTYGERKAGLDDGVQRFELFSRPASTTWLHVSPVRKGIGDVEVDMAYVGWARFHDSNNTKMAIKRRLL